MSFLSLTPRDNEILRIAVPSIVSNITVPLLGLMDVAITGHLGGAAFVGAIAVGGMLFNIIYWLFAFLRMGTSGMTAQAYGANDMGEVGSLLRRNVGVALIISTLLLFLQIPIRNLALYLISPSDDVISLTCTYYNTCIWGAPAALLLLVLNGWYIGMQNSRMPMLIAIIQNVANIIFSLVFVYCFGMKIEGVALGTVLAQYVVLVPFLTFPMKGLFAGKPLSPLAIICRAKDSGIQNRVSLFPFKGRAEVDGVLFLRTLCLIFVHFYFIAAGAQFGDTALAVNALLMQMFLLYSYIMDGFAFAGEALVGKAFGAKDRILMMETIKRLFMWGGAMIVVFTVCYALLGTSFLRMLSDDADVVAAAMEYHPWTLLFPICGMAAFIWDGVFIGATATKGMLLSTAIGMAIFFVFFQIFSPILLNHGLWLAFCCYILMRGMVQTAYFIRRLA